METRFILENLKSCVFIFLYTQESKQSLSKVINQRAQKRGEFVLM